MNPSNTKTIRACKVGGDLAKEFSRFFSETLIASKLGEDLREKADDIALFGILHHCGHGADAGQYRFRRIVAVASKVPEKAGHVADSPRDDAGKKFVLGLEVKEDASVRKSAFLYDVGDGRLVKTVLGETAI